MAEHTPTPWVAEPEYENGNPTYIHKDGHGIADCSMGYGMEDDANAAFIVKAVNNHEALVDRLKEARLQIEYMHSKFDETGTGNAVLARINATLSDVGGARE
ncbi:hypothetical protein ABIF96_005748 [Bradyrhizobium ottawaense]|uniref:hypothetical protein n=1 Tax=Bradyrhizobium ottawaense TaxID=931866 RepID=UPI003839AC2D